MIKRAEPYARIMNRPPYEDAYTCGEGVEALRKIEWIGRISHRSEEKQTQDSWDRFLRAVVIGHGDWSITEHVSITSDILVDRGIQTEVVRHRLSGYTIESTRFVNYEKQMGASYIQPDGLTEEQSAAWTASMEDADFHYQDLLAKGLAPQIARDAFPLALSGRIIMTCNLRNWRHFFLMRTTREAHPKMRRVTIPLLQEFQQKIPILFEDITPMARQVENIGKGR